MGCPARKPPTGDGSGVRTDASRAQAYQQALREGYSGIEANRRRTRLSKAPWTPPSGTKASDLVKRATFNQQNGYGVMGAAVRAVNNFSREMPGNRLIVPFVNVVGNVVNEGLNYSPVGAFRAAWAWTKYRHFNKQGKGLTLYGEPATKQDLADLYAKSIGANHPPRSAGQGCRFIPGRRRNDDPEKDWAIFGFGPRDPGSAIPSEARARFRSPSVSAGDTTATPTRRWEFRWRSLQLPGCRPIQGTGPAGCPSTRHYAMRQFGHVILQQSFPRRRSEASRRKG